MIFKITSWQDLNLIIIIIKTIIQVIILKIIFNKIQTVVIVIEVKILLCLLKDKNV